MHAPMCSHDTLGHARIVRPAQPKHGQARCAGDKETGSITARIASVIMSCKWSVLDTLHFYPRFIPCGSSTYLVRGVSALSLGSSSSRGAVCLLGTHCDSWNWRVSGLKNRDNDVRD